MINFFKENIILVKLFFFVSFLLCGDFGFAQDIKNPTGNKDKESTHFENEDGYVPPQTLFDGKKVHMSGYGGPAIRFGLLNESLVLFTGGKGGWMINDSIVIGGSGYGMIIPKLQNPGHKYETGLGYGGFLLEYIFFPKSLINFSTGIVVGGGGGLGSVFFVLEPEVNLFVNVTPHFKIGISGAYRYSSGLRLENINDQSFRGISAGLILEFGKF